MTVLPILALALLDSLSVGTLVIPLALILRRRRVDVLPLATYFLSVVALYFGFGVLLLLGFEAFYGVLERALQTQLASWVQLVLGLALAVYGIFTKTPPLKPAREVRVPARPTLTQMAALGVGAAFLELATMLPYLAAIGLLSGLDLTSAGRMGWLLIYCLVMVLPALVISALCLIWGDALWPRLERVLSRLEREAAITLLWLAAIVGVYMVVNAAGRLFTA